MAEANSTRRAYNFVDLTGQVFGKLTVVGLHEITPRKTSRWLCRCECGVMKVVGLKRLREGTKSCGCLQRERVTTHGLHRRPEYRAWQEMIRRCHKANHHAWAGYGGRGIVVCDRWRESVEAFYFDMGARPSSQHSLDRINNDGNYEPGNCRWATTREQNNNRRDTCVVTFNGETLPISLWAARIGIRKEALRNRLYVAGWSVERALTTPRRGADS